MPTPFPAAWLRGENNDNSLFALKRVLLGINPPSCYQINTPHNEDESHLYRRLKIWIAARLTVILVHSFSVCDSNDNFPAGPSWVWNICFLWTHEVVFQSSAQDAAEIRSIYEQQQGYSVDGLRLHIFLGEISTLVRNPIYNCNHSKYVN